ncbi:MAG: nitronate monooxygenase [Saprospiraceae bacterium]|nr:nitronate monooxygenase [Saprospiraceae bacterium]MBK8295762.1 nitronate monooxygenase [Saprospiraceae bacterium]
MHTRLTKLLGIQYPVLMAPMFLVSNVAMVKAAAASGIAGCIPALNFRTNLEFRKALEELQAAGICYGINLIVNRSNYKFKDQLKLVLEFKVPFVITSLGNPFQVIEACKPKGIYVFCDVSTIEYAHKAAALHPDGLIAVTNQAGGHLGPLSPQAFVPELIRLFPNLLIISAGGVGDYKSFKEKLGLGVDGVSVGTVFIASEEADVCMEYKQACVDYGAKDIVCTTKLSGIPCTVINTDYVKKIGIKQNALQKLLSKNKTLKKWFKLWTYKRGMDTLYNAAFDAGYHNVWCAGTTVDYIDAIRPVSEITKRIVSEK